jgi:hypothetical protein
MFSEVKGNAWELWGKGFDGLCITSNGYVTKAGKCVMGRGIALEAKTRIKGLDEHLGTLIKRKGNIVHELGVDSKGNFMYSFPVKHKWDEAGDIELIKLSCMQLMAYINDRGLQAVLLPRPGCGNGKLKWEDVSKVIAPLLDERVYVVSF